MRRYLVDVDLANNELLNVRLQPVTDADTPVNRKIAYHTDRNDVASMEANKSRCLANISMFQGKILQEDESIKRFGSMIATLTQDLSTPNVITLDMTASKPSFKDGLRG